MKKVNTEVFKYKDYLDKLKKNDITKLLDSYNLSYQKNNKKDKLIQIIIDNLDNIVESTLDIFQEDELININYVIKKKGYVVVTINNLLLSFLNTMVDNYLMFKEEDDEFVMPLELCDLFKEKIKRKTIVNKIKNNTKELNLILGNIDAYGIIEFDYFYNNYSKLFKLTKDVAFNRINKLSTFYKEYHILTDKNKKYIASNQIKNIKEAKEYLKNEKYAVYTNEELIDIHSFRFMKKVKSYKKLIHFIESHYEVEKGSFKVINKYLIIPFLEENQINRENANELCKELVDKYFEFSKEKYREKFISLLQSITLDYPSWSLRGYTERNK